ncbi:HlyC/CorC family transporter [Candidatus Aerophobetes bacterium]|nr:HlyC/CorC family transporter [Candidatus Aerophobetes bacterium]
MDESSLILIFLGICIILSAFFSGAEIALSSLDKITLKKLVKENKKEGQWVQALLRKPSSWLITVLIGNNLVNIAAASLATLFAAKIVGGTPGKIVGIVTGIMTFIILIFGEIIPKRYCQQHALPISLKIAKPIYFLSVFFSPLVKVLTLLTQGILKVSGSKEVKKNHLITEKEIHTLIDIGAEEGILEKKEEEMAHSALEFDETQAKEIMVPRTKVVCIEEEENLYTLLELIKKVGYSRIPVYRKTIDNIVGIAYAKDLLNFFSKIDKSLKVKQIMHPPIFVPYTTHLSELFRKLQKEKTHLAIIVDEYGGVAGIITIEDLLEEIVGEIEDEYDLKKEKIISLENKSFLIDADTNINEVNEKIGTHFPEKTEAFESIGGFIIYFLGRIPQKGETIEYQNLKINITEADEKHIEKIKLTLS